MAEFGISLDEAWSRFPIAAALVLMPASLERQDKKPAGPSAEMQAFLKAASES